MNSILGVRFRQWATSVLREYLLRGYSVNTRLNQLEDRVDRRFAQHDSRMAAIEQKVDFFVQTQTPPLKGVFYDGQLWDARALVLKLIASAKRSLILIDNWATSEVLDLFAKKREGVKVTIFTSEHYDSRRPLQRTVPRPFPRHRRQGTLSHWRLAEGSWRQVLRLHKDGLPRNTPHQENRFLAHAIAPCGRVALLRDRPTWDNAHLARCGGRACRGPIENWQHWDWQHFHIGNIFPLNLLEQSKQPIDCMTEKVYTISVNGKTRLFFCDP